VNAGRTSQRGIETQLAYDFVLPSSTGTFSRLRLWNNLTLTDYRYRNYQQGTVDLSNNRIPGVAPTTNVTGIDAETKQGLYAHLTYQFLKEFALNDANTVLSDPTQLLQATLGFRRNLGQHWTIDVYASGDNLLDRTYSLGYDLNAVGNRYFNAAPARNFVGGVRLRMNW
jgi:iron complex outermembrane receptor protein